MRCISLLKLLWVDDRSLDQKIFSLISSAAKSKEIELVVAGEDGPGGPAERGFQTIKNFRSALDACTDHESSFAGFIIDIQIPSISLKDFDERFAQIPTNRGRDAGFQLAKFVLNNSGNGGSLESIYKYKYSEIPVLFLSVSPCTSSSGGDSSNNNSFTHWMGDKYADLSLLNSPIDLVKNQYCHFLKRTLRNQEYLFTSWLDAVVDKKRA